MQVDKKSIVVEERTHQDNFQTEKTREDSSVGQRSYSVEGGKL